MTPRDITQAYAAPAGLAILVGLLCHFEGDPQATTFHKVLIALIFPFALRGLRSFFKTEEDAARSWPAEVEFQGLSACLIAAFFVLVVTPDMQQDAFRQILMFLLFIGLAVPMQLFFAWRKRRS